MIIVSLLDGLGNQMFQYAAARSLAEKHSTAIKLDVNSFESNKLRSYALHCFNIQEHLATQNEINLFLKRPRSKLDRFFYEANKLLNISKESNHHFLQEESFHYNSCFSEAPSNTYISGYWQSEKYFAHIKDILICEFSIKYPQDPYNKELSDKINCCESVSLHVRRGDYIQNPDTYQLHGVCDRDYYNRCIVYLIDRIRNPCFFIFSDEPQWVKENLTFKFPFVIIEHNKGFRSYEDLRLMSQCKYNIIANSSFSWWGAWLNQSPDRIVCAPKHWFSNNIQGTKYSLNEGVIPWYKDDYLDTKDLLPESWIKL